MEIGSTGNFNGHSLNLARNENGEAKHISELFQEIYTAEEREAIAERYLDTVRVSDEALEGSEKHARERLEYYTNEHQNYSSLLDIQSDGLSLSDIEENIRIYQRQVEYFENYSQEGDKSRQSMFDMAAMMLGVKEEEAMNK